MCGIFGSISLIDTKPNNSAKIVSKGIDLLKHRGPDGHDVIEHNSFCLGHSRLSIIDLVGGHQPMWSENRRGIITYNGELYNYPSLRKELLKLGYNFVTNSDTEVILNSFLEWGPDCLKHFRGMFAFAAVDLKKNKAILARDRIGIKPLFYTVKDDQIFFSSELEPLYKTLGPLKINLEALDDYLYWQYISAPKTIYKEVYNLPPAHFIVIDLLTGEIITNRYWTLNFKEDRSISNEDWEHRLDETLREAVGMHLISDVPFGAFLSGGIDSSLVVGYMSEIMKQPINTFSIGFKEADYSELSYAEKIARINHTKHHTEIVKPESLSLLPFLVSHYGQPFADSSAIPTYYVSQMARKNVKMVLSGDGGDENFAGYNSYEYILNQLNNVSKPASRKKQFYNLKNYFLNKFLDLINKNNIIDRAYELHCGTAQHFPPDERERILKTEYRHIIRRNVPERKSLINIDHQPLISRLQNMDLMAYLPFDILTKVDVASMANSLEVRVPLLDHILIETAATMPTELKLKEDNKDGKTSLNKKYILKQLATRRYPSDIINRPKMGFGVPLGKWFKNELNNEVKNRLLKSPFIPLFFDVKIIAELIDKHSETFDCSAKLWNLLFLEEWMKSHHDAL